MGKNSEPNEVFQFPTFTLEELFNKTRLMLQGVFNEHPQDVESELLLIAERALALYTVLHFKSSKL